jgi:eukaryotic-like serine/threonine-protein kinase
MRTSVVLAAMLLLAACAPAEATPAPASGLVAQDVLTYRGDPARTGVMPGPGPSAQPAIRWQLEMAGPIGASPVVVDGFVLVVSEDGILHAADLVTGERRWEHDLGADARAATPQVVDGIAVLGDVDGVLHGIAATDGVEAWSTRLDGPVTGGAAAAGDVVVAATTAGSAYGVDAATGEVRWRTTLPGPVSRSVAVEGDVAYLSVDGGHVVALRIRDGTTVWDAVVADSGEGGTPTIAGGLVFAATGFHADAAGDTGVSALDAATGALRWRFASPTGHDQFTPAVLDGWAWTVGGDASVVAFDAATGRQRWSTTTDGPNDALPAVTGGIVYVATNGGSMRALDATTGELRWQVPIEGVPYAPVVTGGFVVVGTSHGRLYAIADPVA